MSMGVILAGKSALVTGGSRGIGREIALALAREGAVVCVHYGASADAATETVGLIRDAGGKAFAVQATFGAGDVSAALLEQVEAGLAAFGIGGLDILVNNAGVGTMAAIADTDEALLDRFLAVNLKAPFLLIRAALPNMRDGGRIITISSMVSVAAYPACIGYAMSKAGVNSFTRSLAAELGARSITVNAIAPGATDTDFISPLRDNAPFMDAIRTMTALGRLGQPSDIASVALFLASPSGGWLTGQILEASGGMHL
jgi:3-oxoacyl-[acyl-carrier protein] reductase